MKFIFQVRESARLHELLRFGGGLVVPGRRTGPAQRFQWALPMKVAVRELFSPVLSSRVRV
jgi:hypothetical protein